MMPSFVKSFFASPGVRPWLPVVTIMLMIGWMPGSASAEPAQTLPIEAPSCKSFSDCDRDPVHMQQFIVSFYKWYVSELGEADSDWHKEPGRTVIKAALTQQFFKKLQSIAEASDADPLTSSQDAPTTWTPCTI